VSDLTREQVSPLSDINAEEIRYLAGVLEILRGGDRLLAEGIKRVVEEREKAKSLSKQKGGKK
jgi:hypothetical protein